MKTQHGPFEGKWRLRTMAGAGMLFMPLASQASDLLWAGRDRGPSPAESLHRRDAGFMEPRHAVYASTGDAHTFQRSISQRNDTAVEASSVSRVLPDERVAYAARRRDVGNETQIAAHVTASTALFDYGGRMNDGLHQRLGEIRNVMPTNDLGGEVFVRYSGSQINVTPGPGSQAGYGFKQQANALQLGGSVVTWNQEGSNLRAGWAYDQGEVRVTPKKSDLGSTFYKAKGMSAWLTAQRDNGLYVDVVAGNRRFNGRINDGAGRASPKVRASGWVTSVEAGLPMALTESLSIEPQGQITYQSLRINPIQNASGLITRSSGRSQQTTARIGVRISKIDNERFVPYMKVDFSKQFAGHSKISSFDADKGIDATFDSVRTGTSMGLSAGMTIKVNRVVDFYADAGMQRHLGGRGANGFAGNAGLRINF